VDICVFTKDPQKDYKAKLAAQPVDNVKKVSLRCGLCTQMILFMLVTSLLAFGLRLLTRTTSYCLQQIIGVTKLRQKYKQFADRRQLLSNYQLFMADARIIPLLPALLGKKFFEKKRYITCPYLPHGLTSHDSRRTVCHHLCMNLCTTANLCPSISPASTSNRS